MMMMTMVVAATTTTTTVMAVYIKVNEIEIEEVNKKKKRVLFSREIRYFISKFSSFSLAFW